MGGYGTLTHALSQPERFAAAGALSAAVIRKKTGNSVSMDEIKKEADAAFPADVTWNEIEGYGHEWRFWDIEIEKFMEWITRTNSYAAGGKRQI